MIPDPTVTWPMAAGIFRSPRSRCCLARPELLPAQSGNSRECPGNEKICLTTNLNEIRTVLRRCLRGWPSYRPEALPVISRDPARLCCIGPFRGRNHRPEDLCPNQLLQSSSTRRAEHLSPWHRNLDRDNQGLDAGNGSMRGHRPPSCTLYQNETLMDEHYGMMTQPGPFPGARPATGF